MYEEGETVIVYNYHADLENGRKLSAPWIGPYVIVKKLSNISYILIVSSWCKDGTGTRQPITSLQ